MAKPVDITVRKARAEDYEPVIAVEAKSTPGLRYLPHVFEMFLNDESGEFLIAEIDGQVVACGKFTSLPDGSAWLEALRVIPECQGLGVGKRFYERFFEIARCKGVTSMRMYTGLRNFASKGLAERFGFSLAASFKGTWRPCLPEQAPQSVHPFQPVRDPAHAVALLMPYQAEWGGYLVMNRTFYPLSAALCADLAHKGFVYEDVESQSVVVLGARFMPEQALHIAFFAGDAQACLDFALQQGAARGVGRLSCLFASPAPALEHSLMGAGFQLESSDFIVMQVKLE